MILGILLNIIAEWKETVKYVRLCSSGVSVPDEGKSGWDKDKLPMQALANNLDLPCKSGWGMDVMSEASNSEVYGTVLGIPRRLVETLIGEAV